jgi:tRNA G18 (ribose-2'-O)-methylase SpoU
MTQSQKDVYLVLHDIRSAHNVGSIFRTADAAGVRHIYISGYTPRPYDGTHPYTTKPERGIIKIALGAQESVPWSGHETLDEVISILAKEKVRLVALEQDIGSIDYLQYEPVFPLALLLGNEPRGIDEETLQRCDDIIELPMYGMKKSLNVSVAAGIALYSLMR